MRTLGLAAALMTSAFACAVPAQAELSGPSVPPPAGCQPVSPAEAPGVSGTICIHRVLVTSTSNPSEQNATDFTVTDHVGTLDATIANWWPQGPPEAGMVVTLWGHWTVSHPDRLVVDRWIDLAHGTGPSPDGPYPVVSELDVSSGKVPNNRTVWVPAIAFALDPQDNGDGDVHVQTFWPCSAAGLTTESTPALRGFVDHPALPGLTSSTDTSDAPHNHLADDPPIGVPVMMLGQIRVDYGFGWYELHPIRAWRPMTAAEIAAAGSACAVDPAPHLGAGPTYAGATVPVPFGVPPCTDGSEFGSPPGFGICSSPHCWVSATAIDRPEVLAGPCGDIPPVTLRSQEGLPERLPGEGLGSIPVDQLRNAEHAGAAEREQFRRGLSPVVSAYGPRCSVAGVRGRRARATCADVLAHLVSGEQFAVGPACQRVATAQRRACARAAIGLSRVLSARWARR
jgi:hypothetical protein